MTSDSHLLVTKSKGPLNKMRLIIQSLRVGVFVLLFGLALLVHLSQSTFFNWDFYWQFYCVSALGILVNLIGLIRLEKLFENGRWLFYSFFFDVLLIATLLYKSELNVSLFLFIFLIEILLMALIFQTRGALLLAAICSLSFSTVSLLGPEMKAMTFFFTLILYNVAFFCLAWISGMLAEQLEYQGISLSDLRALNESIVQTIPSGLLSVTQEGIVLTANPGALQIFKKESMEGENLHLLLPDFAMEFKKWFSSAHTGAATSFKTELPLRRDGDNLILQIQVISQKTESSDFLVMLEDVTEVRRLELTILHQQKLAAIGGLASGIAHELGNPLAAVSANIQFLEPKIKIEDETDKKLIHNTHREIARLGRLIGEFKDYAKPEKISVDPIRLDLILKNVLEIVKNDKNLRNDVLLHTDLEILPEIRGSQDKLLQAFLNVIINAFQALATTENPELQISAKVIGLEVVVRIRDNGSGMSEETKTRLFEPFYTTKGRSGTGLGLAITFKILQAHEANISVDSKKNQGTEFIFRFPIKTGSRKS